MLATIWRLLVALSIVAVFGIAASAASAVEAPFYKVGGKRLGAKETKEVALEAEGNQVLINATSKITVTCAKVAAEKFVLIGSAAGEPGTGEGKLVYSGCTVSGNGEGCQVSEGEKGGFGWITNALKSIWTYGKKIIEVGVKILSWVEALKTVWAVIKFIGSHCTFLETSVEGTLSLEMLNSKKEVVAVKEHELEEEFGFIRMSTNEACFVAKSAFTECRKPSLKAFGTAATLGGTAKVKLVSKEKFGVFSA